MSTVEMRSTPVSPELMQQAKVGDGQKAYATPFDGLLNSFQALLAPPVVSIETASNTGQDNEEMDSKEESWDEAQTLMAFLMQSLSGSLTPDEQAELKDKANRLIEILGSMPDEQMTTEMIGQREKTSSDSSLIQALANQLKTKGFSLPADLEGRLSQALKSTVSVNDSIDVEEGQSKSQQLPPFLFLHAAGSFQASPAITGISSGVLPNLIHRENFMTEMTDFLTNKIRVTQSPGLSEAKVTLYPEQFGQLDVKISIQQGQLAAQFIADTSMGRDLLEANLAALRTALQQQGIQVDKLEVYQSGDAGLLSQQQHRDQSGAFQQNRQEKRSSSELRVDQRREGDRQYYQDFLIQPVSITSSASKNIDFSA